MKNSRKLSKLRILIVALLPVLVTSVSVAAAADLVGFSDGSAPTRQQFDLVNRARILPKAKSDFADDFSSGSINRSNYNRSEAIREIDRTQGMLHVYTGANNSTAGVNFTRTNNWITGSESHTVIEADVIITEIKFGSANHPAFAHLGGTFYSNSSTENGRLGHVFTQIKAGNKGNGFEVWGHMGVSKDVNFQTEDSLEPVEILAPGVASIGDSINLKIEYNGDNSFTFIAKVNGNSFTKTTQGPTKLNSATGMKRVGTGIDWDDENGVVDKSRASVDALFDNVKSSSGFFSSFSEDFSEDFINSSKWDGATEEKRIVVEVNEDKAVFMEATGDGDQRDVNLEIRDETNYLEADLMLSSRGNLQTGTRGLVRIQGQWYNDTFSSNYNGNEGDVYAHVIIDRTTDQNLVAKAYAERNDNSTGSDVTTLLDNEVFTINVQFDTFYKASIEFTGSSLIFIFSDERIVMPIDTAVNEPFFKTKRIRARVTQGAGTTVAYIDNVRTDKNAQFPDTDTTPEEEPTDNDNEETTTGGSSGSGAPSVLLLVLIFGFGIRKQLIRLI